MKATEAKELSTQGFGDNSPIEDLFTLIKAEALRRNNSLTLTTSNGIENKDIETLLQLGYKVMEENVALPGMPNITNTIIVW